MFGLIRKKKVIEAIYVIAEDYNDSNRPPRQMADGPDRVKWAYYCDGNMNCANYIWSKIGCKGPIMVNGVPQDGRSEA